MKKTSILFVCMFALVALVTWAPTSDAFNQWSTNVTGGNCANCHGDFRGNPYTRLGVDQGWGSDLHDVHRFDMLSGDCDTCHTQGPRFPVLLDDSAGGTGFPSISCVGCHGREEDLNTSPTGAENRAAGLRQHHENASAASCGICHSDNLPANFTAVGENVLPPYYFTPDAAHPNKPTDPCNPAGEEDYAGSVTGIDNDGNLLYDGDDPNCQAANNPPVAVDDAFATVHDTALNVAAPGVLGNDTDADGDALTAVLQTGPTNGTLTLNTDGSFSYTPNALFVGADSFTYVANDGQVDSNVATVTIDVTNAVPVANDDAANTAFETAVDINVLANDTDADGDVLAVNRSDATSANGGTVSCNATCLYTPPAGFTGPDTFIYDVNDGIAVSNPATVTVTVGEPAANTPPVANDDAFATVHDTALAVAAPGVLGNDTDADGDALTAVLQTGPTNGTLTLNTDGSFSYTPNDLFVGADSFTYVANDGQDNSNVATVTIDVTNAVPVANDDAANTPFETAVDINVLANDTDADGDVLSINSFDAISANGGTVSCTTTCLYTPPAGFSGPDTFTYDATDGIAVSNPATVTVTVGEPAANNPPLAVDDTASTPFETPVDIDVLANDTDADGDVLTVNTFDAASANGGTVSCDTLATTPTPQCTYTPPAGFSGDDTFTYDATDGIDVSNRATVTVTVGAQANNPPVAVDDAFTTDEDVMLNVAAPGVLANDSDPDGDTLTAMLQTGTANGALTLNADGSFTYTPDPNFNGADSFTYVANDGQLDSNVATVSITVNAVNDAPIANDDAATTTVDTPVDIDVLANDVDVDGDDLSINDFDPTSANGGTVSCGATCLYTPPTGFTGDDTFTYDATDGDLVSNRATVTITVQVDKVDVIEVKVKVPRAINPKNRGITPIKIFGDTDQKIAEVTCGPGDGEPKRLFQRVFHKDSLKAVGLFKTRELDIECRDKTLTCTGTLADGTEFMGTSNKFKTVGRVCKDKHDRDDDKHGRDDDKHGRNDDKRDRDDDKRDRDDDKRDRNDYKHGRDDDDKNRWSKRR